MRIVLILMRKEFLQIFRNRAMLPILFAMPIIQLLVLAFAVTYEIRSVPISVVDADRSTVARDLVEKLEASGTFVVASRPPDLRSAGEDLLRGRTEMILAIPRGMERDLHTVGTARIQMILDAEDGAAAGVIQAYATQIIATLNREIQVDFRPTAPPASHPRIEVAPRHWYNPALDYQTFMVPGILVLLVTMIGTFLSAMNVVREKEIGTIEQLNVTPIRKSEFLVAKLMPFWIIALAELAAGLVVARILFDIPMLGSLWLLFGLAGVYLVVMLGIGLWISTVTETQQQAMFVAWFIMVIFILMSGLFTPIDSMPRWAQLATRLNPIAYFIEIVRRVMLKGAGLADVQVQLWALVGYAAVMLTLAVRQYRKVSA
jgi:ABC-2 type transport system permease protein